MPLRDMPCGQAWLLPPSLDELLPLHHPARFVAEFVDALDREDWKELGVEIEGDPLGARAYHPRALLSVWLFGFVTGIRSSRKLESACRDQIPYLWLTGWQHPDHNTLWRFYKDHRQAMRSLFKRTVRTAVAMELVDLAVQAVDGTKVAANASSGRSYDAEGLAKLLERLDRAIAELEDQNEGETDGAPVHLPEKLADKRTLRDQLRRAMDELQDLKGCKSVNLTDRDARFMKMRQGFLEPVYNLFRISVAKARTTICRLVLSFRSQFFQSRRHFSSQAKDRSTTHLFGSTTKVCSSLRFTTSTAAPNRLRTPAAKGFPV